MEAGLRLRNFSGEVGCCVPRCEKMPHALQSGIAQSLSGRHLGRSFEAVTSMTRWIYHFYQYLAIYNNGHLSNTSIIIGPCRSKILPSTKLTLQKLPKTLNFQPKWRNFAKSGHTAHEVTVVVSRVDVAIKWSISKGSKLVNYDSRVVLKVISKSGVSLQSKFTSVDHRLNLRI